MKAKFTTYAAMALAAIIRGRSVCCAAADGNTVPVTVENFIRAESDLYMSAVALKEDGFGKFEHHRELSPDRRPNHHSAKPRHALFRGGVRSRRRTGDVHTARCGQAFHVAASDQ